MSGPLQARPSCLCRFMPQAVRPHGSGLPCVAPRVASHEAVPLVDEGAEVTPHSTSHSPYQGFAQLLSTPFTMAGSRTLDRLARRLLLWSQDKFLSLRAVHVPGILNLAAHFLSRQKLRPGEWMLNRQTISQIWDLFGKAEVDLFASQESSQCPLWFSLSFPTTLGIDAFAHPWPNVSLYACPPIKLIPAVLCRVKVSSAHLLLIAPYWPSQTRFSELTPLLYRSPWEIPIRRDLLSQLQSRISHPQPELWKLWVWPIQGQGP